MVGMYEIPGDTEGQYLVSFRLTGEISGGRVPIRNVPPKPLYHFEKRWVSVYQGVSHMHETIAEADECATSDRVACVEIDWPMAGGEE